MIGVIHIFASWEFDFDSAGLFYPSCDKVVYQTLEKTNKPDSGSIYILLCNSLDFFCLWVFFYFNFFCGFIAEINNSVDKITFALIKFFVKEQCRQTSARDNKATPPCSCSLAVFQDQTN